jgi:hypothetical protein
MQVKGLHIAFLHCLFDRDRRKTGNGLVTVRCPAEMFSCLFPALPVYCVLSENAVNQLVCFGLRKIAFFWGCF